MKSGDIYRNFKQGDSCFMDGWKERMSLAEGFLKPCGDLCAPMEDRSGFGRPSHDTPGGSDGDDVGGGGGGVDTVFIGG
jgi:hypothetical protein